MDDRAPLRLVVVTPGRGDVDDLLAMAAGALRGGATSIWIRERDRTDAALRRLAAAMRDLAEPHRAWVWISGRPDLAVDCGLHAVHLGLRDPSPRSVAETAPPLRIGMSAHDPIDRDALAHADHITLSPLFQTPSKRGVLQPLGPSRFQELTASVDVPVVALGGIDAGNAGVAIAAGATGVCVMRAVTDAPDPERAAAELRAAIEEARW